MPWLGATTKVAKTNLKLIGREGLRPEIQHLVKLKKTVVRLKLWIGRKLFGHMGSKAMPLKTIAPSVTIAEKQQPETAQD